MKVTGKPPYIHAEYALLSAKVYGWFVHDSDVRADGNEEEENNISLVFVLSLSLRISTSTSTVKTSHRNNARRIMSALRLKSKIARVTHDRNNSRTCAALTVLAKFLL